MTKKFLVIGNRGGFYHVRGQKDTREEAVTLAGSCAAGSSYIQFTYIVAEVLDSFKSFAPYTRKRSK